MNLSQRVVAILTSPSTEWPAIAAERSDVSRLYREYIAILAAIPAIALLAGLSISGGRFLGTVGMVTALTAALVGYGITLASVMLAAVAIAKLAGRFGASHNTIAALKLVAYSSTAVWVAGVFYVSPLLSQLVFVGVLYAIYLFFLGLSPVMHTPLDQRVPFMVVCALVILVVNIALRSVASLVNVPYYGF